VVVSKSGHEFNHAFLKEFFSRKESWEARTINTESELPSGQPKSLAI